MYTRSCELCTDAVQAREALEKGEKYTYTVTEQLISDALGDLLRKKDLSKYIL